MKYALICMVLLIFSNSSFAQDGNETMGLDSLENGRMNKVYIGFFSGYNGLSKAPALAWHGNYQRQIIDQLSIGLSLGYVQSTTSSNDLDLSQFDTTISGRKISQGYFKTSLIVGYTQSFKNPAHQMIVGIGPSVSFNRKAQVIREDNEDDFFLEEVLTLAGRKGQFSPGMSGIMGYTFTGKRNFVCGIHVIYDAFFGKNSPTFFNILPGVSLGGSF